MRRINFELMRKAPSGWSATVLMIEAFLRLHCKAHEMLDQLPKTIVGHERTRAQGLLLDTIRHGMTVERALQPLLRKPPKPRLRALLAVAGTELLLHPDPSTTPKIVHHAVDRARALVSKNELGFVNAVLRKLPESIARLRRSEALPLSSSHPDWLVEHWTRQFGPERTTALLAWNQKNATNYLRTAKSIVPAGLTPTRWDGFYALPAGPPSPAVLEALASGLAFIKDPATRHACEALDLTPGSTVLDLCAAPGGKTFEITQALQGQGQVIALDFGSDRLHRLKENVEKMRHPALRIEVLEMDLLELDAARLESRGLPLAFPKVLIDVPCSNTGVIQRRPDLRWRLHPADISASAEKQLSLIRAAAHRVALGGTLVYSTCSIEARENEEVVAAFLDTVEGRGFDLNSSRTFYPWETEHDGAGVHKLTRVREPAKL